jgi:hypothetical protein
MPRRATVTAKYIIVALTKIIEGLQAERASNSSQRVVVSLG